MTVFECLDCGTLFRRASRPDKCPVCKNTNRQANRAKFKRLSDPFE